ncbi:MAG: soluble lytic murein transglycosylase [Bradymonadia bacterium]
MLASLETGEALARLDRRILVEHPESPAGRARLAQVAALNLADQLSRARRLFSRRAYDLAEPAWAAVGRLSKDPELRQQAALVRGTIELRIFGDALKAAGWLAGAAQGPDRARAAEALFRQGVALGRLKQCDAAIVAMRASVARHPKGRFAQGAAYEIGRLMHEAGRFSQAAAQIAAFLKTRRRRDPAKYRWFEGWSHFRAGAHRKARRVFAKLISKKNLLVGPKALYWTARSHAAEKNPRAALKTLKILRKRAPWSYYGVLGDTLARRLDPKGYVPMQRPARLHRAPQVPDLRSWLPFTPLRVLARAGYPRRATAPDKIRDPLARASVRHAAERFGVRWQAVADRRLPWRAGLEKVPADQVAAAYPNAYWMLAEAAGRLHGVSPWWLLGHMLQESRFKARARSHAGALGPMQVLPRTGLRIAARLGLPRGDFSADQLFAPGIALRHAAWYLAALRDEFGGSILLAIAAYNGGPLRFAAHVETYRDLPFDVMIEEIGAHESRNYVRKVVDHLIRFALVYASDAEFMGLVDAIRPLSRVPAAKGEVRF